MAVSLSVKAQLLLKQNSKEPQAVLDIEGLDLIFGLRPIVKVLTWDDDSEEALWDNNLFWDGSIQDSNSRDYISFDGTTNSITQQIQPDKSSTSSISTVTVSLVNKNNEASKALSFENITDILGKKAKFAIGFVQGNYPEDFTNVFIGAITDFYTDAGTVNLTISSSESLKRQLFLPKFQTELTSAIGASATTLNVTSTAGIYASQDALTTYVRVDDEIMQVVSFTNTSINVIRDQLNSTNESHDIEANVETFYRLQGKALDLARKIMLSNEGNTYFLSDDVPKSINFVSVSVSISNAIIFDYFNIKEKTGLTIGDTVKLDSALNTGTYTIIGFDQLDNGDSYILVSETLNTESEYNGTFEYRSKWNTLPAGLDMLSNEVDLDQFDDISNSFGSGFPVFDLYIKDSIDNAKDFIDKKLFFVNGLYSIPRKARSSVKYLVPPFTSEIIAPISTDSILNASKLRQRRSTHKYFYNAYVWKYNLDSIDDKFLSGRVIVSTKSKARINTGFKQLKIEADGLRNNPSNTNFITQLSQRFVNRYQFAPTYVSGVEVNYKNGYRIEVGDVIPFGSKELQIADLQTGNKGSNTQLFEVVNKSLNIKNGLIKLDLLNTNFEIEARYAVFSLASNVIDFPTTNSIKIIKTNDTGAYINESDKWVDFIESNIRIRSTDYTEDYTTILTGISSSDNAVLEFRDAITYDSAKQYVVEIPTYTGDQDFNAEYKLRFSHMVAQAVITSVTSNSVFDVDDGTKLVVGSQIYVHSKDYSDDSFEQEIEIIDITGNTVTLSEALTFTPQVNYLVDSTNFKDGGFAYKLI